MNRNEVYKCRDYNRKNATIIQNMNNSQSAYKLQIKMGQTHVHPQNLNSVYEHPHKAIQSPTTFCSEVNYESQEHRDSWEVQPIIIPCFITRESPFKGLIEKQQMFSPLKGKNICQIQKVDEKLNETQKGNESVKPDLWVHALYDSKLLCIIFDLLPCQSCLNLAMTNHRLFTQFYLYRLYYLQNNWNFTKYYLDKKQILTYKVEYIKLLNQSYAEQSEHSLDLDRLQSLFLSQQDVSYQLSRVDKIMRVVNCAGVSYFQGLNCIVVVLASAFDDQTAFRLTLLLLEKSNNICNNPDVYEQMIASIDKKVKEKCPKLHSKLQLLDFGIEYFGMKWIMGLFASDLCRIVLMHLWDLILNFGIEALEWFIVSIFMVLETEIMEICDPDQINRILKSGLKNIIKQQKGKNAIKITKVMIGQQIFGEGCEQIYKSKRGYNEQILNYLHANFATKQKSGSLGINVIKEQENQQEEPDTKEIKAGHINQIQGVGYQTFRTQFKQQVQDDPIYQQTIEQPCDPMNLEQDMETQKHENKIYEQNSQITEMQQTEIAKCKKSN